MDSYIRVFVVSLLSAVIMFILTKIMGSKQICQMSMFDYITGITIGSIAAEMATNLEGDPGIPAFSMVVYGLLAYLISVTTSKSIILRRFLNGKLIVLMENGVIYRESMKKARLDLCDFMTLCRNAGYFNLAEIDTAIFEFSGNISIIPRAAVRPATPEDMNIAARQEHICANLVIDGKLMPENLRYYGKDEKWLSNQLHAQGFRDFSEVFLCVGTSEGQISAFRMTDEKYRKNMLE